MDQKVPSSGPPAGLASSGRPSNYEELAELSERCDPELAWSLGVSSCTSSSATSRRASSPCRRRVTSARIAAPYALLAGVAEYLSERYGLPVPEWVHEPENTLSELWDPWEDLCPDMEETRHGRIERSPPGVHQAPRRI